MSTILDALRKVEEDSRTRNADVRTRLLTSPTRFQLRTSQRQRSPWVIGMGLSLLGVAIGVGLTIWSWSTRPVSEVSAVAKRSVPSQPVTQTPSPTPTTSPVAPEVATAAVQPAAQPVPGEAKEVLQIASSPQLTADPTPVHAQPDPMQTQHHPEVGISVTPPSGGASVSIIPSPPLPTTPSLPNTPEKVASPEELANPVQRSPFVSTPEPERLVPPSPPSERRMAVPQKPPVSSSPPKVGKTGKAPPVVPTPAAVENESIGETTSPPTAASLNFLQWSPDPEKRIAFIKIGDGPTTLAHEGDKVGGVTVLRIRQDAVDLQSGDSRWTLRAR